MNETEKQRILDKNRRLMEMVIERARRDFPEDIAIIGLTGSFQTGDFHEKSDLDLIIINDTKRGWEIATCFILDDVGYDIYCTPWESRIEAQSKLESPMASCLLDMQVLYCAKPEHMDRLNAYRQKALDLLALPIGKECIGRAKVFIDRAKQNLAEAMLSDATGDVRYAIGGVLHETVNALTSLNNTYIKRGVKRYLEQILSYAHQPDNLEAMYMTVIRASTVPDMREAAAALLRGLVALYDRMVEAFGQRPVPTRDNLRGTYEELWCNCRNKVLASVRAGDVSYAFHAALGAQSYLDEMTAIVGTKRFDVMGCFDADDLPGFQEAFLRMMDEYAAYYDALGVSIVRYDSLEDLSRDFMGQDKA